MVELYSGEMCLGTSQDRNSNRACGSIAGGNAAERIIRKIKCQPGTIDSGIWNPV